MRDLMLIGHSTFVIIGLHVSLFLFDISVVDWSHANYQRNTNSFYVESWKKGITKIHEHAINLSLTTDNKEISADINSQSNIKTYSLIIKHKPASNAEFDYDSWIITLFETADRQYNLLLPEKPNNWAHNFPRENSIAWLDPLENPDYLKYGFYAFPLSSKRIIKIESFYCIIQVEKYKLNDKNPKVFDSLSVHIEFTNNPPPDLNRTR